MSKLNIPNNKVVKFIYEQEKDFDYGRGFLGKFSSLTNEFNFAILVSTFLFGVNLQENMSLALKWTIFAVLLIYLFGKIYRRSGLLEQDRRAAYLRDPIQKKILLAAEKILEGENDGKTEKSYKG